MRVAYQDSQQGFSLIELMISMAIGLAMAAALGSTFLMQRDAYDIQGQITEATQTTRAALDTMRRDIRMAGYDPTGAGFDGVTYSSSQLYLQSDLNGNGTTVGETNERITYAYYDATDEIKRDTGSGFEPFADNIESFTFEYLDSAGNPTVYSSAVRQMRITVTARTEKPDPDYAQNNGYRTVTLTCLVVPHNLGYPKGTGITTTTTTGTTASTTSTSTTTTTATTGTTLPGSTTTTTTTTATTTTTTTSSTTTTLPVDTTCPTIAGITQDPPGGSIPNNTTVDVLADVSDPSGINVVILVTNFGPINMGLVSGITYGATIPKHNNRIVTYNIYAEDSLGNSCNSATYRYTQG